MYKFEPQPTPPDWNIADRELIGEILSVIKKRKLTYKQAYMNLQIVYETLRYESNFVQVDQQFQIDYLESDK